MQHHVVNFETGNLGILQILKFGIWQNLINFPSVPEKMTCFAVGYVTYTHFLCVYVYILDRGARRLQCVGSQRVGYDLVTKPPHHTCVYLCSSVGKDSACNAGDPGLTPGSGRFAGDGISDPLQYSSASLVAQMVKNPPAM